jgi:hypothetical protein
MAALVLGFASLVMTATAPAQSNTSGTVSVESKAVALGVGVSWGDGTLTYRGKQHKFSVEGLSVLDLGVSKVSAKGEVSDLKKLEDFAGTYVAAWGRSGGGRRCRGRRPDEPERREDEARGDRPGREAHSGRRRRHGEAEELGPGSRRARRRLRVSSSAPPGAGSGAR